MQETTTTRMYKLEKLRATDADGDTPARISGLAVPFNAESEDLGGFREVFKPGAFKGSLGGDIFADIEHDRTQRLARSSKGTLRFQSKRDGLHTEMDVPDTQVGRDALEDVRNGNLDGMSIAFSNPEETWKGKGDNIVREINSADLKAVTLTSFPAYRQTAGTLAERSLAEYRESLTGENNNDNGGEGDDSKPAVPLSVRERQLKLAEAEV